MGKLEYFKIILDRPAFYRPGDFVSGVVVLKSAEKLKINSISVCIDNSASSWLAISEHIKFKVYLRDTFFL